MAISDTIKKGVIRAPHRSLLRATGVVQSESDFEKPFTPSQTRSARSFPGMPAWTWLELRRASWTRPAPKIDYGYLARYAAQVTSAGTGAVLAPPDL